MTHNKTLNSLIFFSPTVYNGAHQQPIPTESQIGTKYIIFPNNKNWHKSWRSDAVTANKWHIIFYTKRKSNRNNKKMLVFVLVGPNWMGMRRKKYIIHLFIGEMNQCQWKKWRRRGGWRNESVHSLNHNLMEKVHEKKRGTQRVHFHLFVCFFFLIVFLFISFFFL